VRWWRGGEGRADLHTSRRAEDEYISTISKPALFIWHTRLLIAVGRQTRPKENYTDFTNKKEKARNSACEFTLCFSVS